MKRAGILAALCVVLAAILLYRPADFGAAPQPRLETAAPPDESTRPAIHRSIAVKDRDGFHRTLRTAPDVDVVVMATWCPYSQELKGFLTDPAVGPYLANRRLVFLFEASEWPRLQRMMVENQGASQEQARLAIAARQRRQRGSPFADGTFLEGLPGEIYFVDDANELGLSGFPSFYSAQTTHFDLGRTNWAVQRLGMPRQLARDLLGKQTSR